MTENRDKIYTVEEITGYIKGLLENDTMLRDIWLTGEISNFNHHRSGHMYFSLKDEGSRINCVMFRGKNRYLDFEPEDGMEVTACGRVSVYPPRGNYQFYVQRLEPEGKGALYRAFEKLKKELKEEGLFDSKNKQDIPLLPGRIGVVTSPSGAAIRDILSVADRRFEHVSILIVPSLVQGEEAAGEIVEAIEYLNECGDIDLIIVSRGGGSIEDLWPFNEEKVARAVYNSRLPVISGVGHETDFTITDFCADVRAPTPSAAAELAISSRRELENRLEGLALRLGNVITGLLSRRRDSFRSLAESRVFRSPEELFAREIQRLDELRGGLEHEIERLVATSRERFGILAGKLDMLSPLKTLERGYTITGCGDCLVTSVDDIKKEDIIQTTVTDGIIESRVSKKRKEGDSDEC
ncbi:MAG: exodeoxyribonuclease VII large subunit [Bacillota bacterium]